jgi:purine-binding chemotaxis protein CheW
VGEIARWHEPLSVPGLPSTLPGIINHRGVVLTVVDMRVLVGFPDVPPNRVTRYIIVHHDDMNMALLVDSVADIINLFDDALEAVPAALDPQKSRLLQAIVRLDDRPVALIDLSAVTNTLLSGA